MSTDDKEFEEIYRSLPPGLAVVTCSPKSLTALRSFFFSLKGAAIRCGSDAMPFSGRYTATDWLTVGIQALKAFLQEHSASGIRLFLVHRFPSPLVTDFLAEINYQRGFDMLDGSIAPNIAGMIRQAAIERNVTIVVPTPANEEDQILGHRVAMLMGKEEGTLITLERERIGDDWYSAMVTIGCKPYSYGPLDFTPDWPRSPEAPMQPVPVARPDKQPEGVPAKRGESWLRRLFG